MTTYGYSVGTNPIMMMPGRVRAFGRKVLLRAIMETDGYLASGGKVQIVTFNTNDAVCFEIMGLGGGVAKWCADCGEIPPTPGQHCEMRSSAADRVHAREALGRFLLVDVEDISGVWDPVDAEDPELLAAIKEWQEIKANAVTTPAIGDGAPTIEPRTSYASGMHSARVNGR